MGNTTVGYAIKPDGDLINVINNSGIKGAGEDAVIDGIVNGAKKLDCFDTGLAEYYSKFGFKEVGRDSWNDLYAPKNWDYAKHGKPDVVYMQYEGGTRNAFDIRQRFEVARGEAGGRTGLGKGAAAADGGATGGTVRGAGSQGSPAADTGRIPADSLDVIDPLSGSQRVYDVLENPARYAFQDPKQQQFFDEIWSIKKETNLLREAEGLKPSNKYKRAVKGIIDADGTIHESVYGSDSGLRRIYESQEQSVQKHLKAGQRILYEDNILNIVQNDLDETIREVARKRFADNVSKLGKTAADKFADEYPAIADQIDVLDRTVRSGRSALKAVQNIITTKGHSMSGSTMAKIKRELPEIGEKLSSLYTIRPDSTDKFIAGLAQEIGRTTKVIHGEYGRKMTNLLKQLNLTTNSSVSQITQKLKANPAEINKYVRLISTINEGWRGRLDITPEDIAAAIRSFNKDSEVIRQGLLSRMKGMQAVTVDDVEKMLKDMSFDEKTINRLSSRAYRDIYATSKTNFDDFLKESRNDIASLIEQAKTNRKPLVKQRSDFLAQYAGREYLPRKVGEEPLLVYNRVRAFKNVFFPAEVVHFMEQNYAARSNLWLKTMGTAGGVSRSMTAVMDDSAPFVQGLNVLGRNPKVWAKATIQQFKMLVQPEYLDNYMVANQAIHDEMTKYGIPMAVTELFEGLGTAEKLIGKTPVIGRAVKKGMEHTYGRAEAAYKGFRFTPTCVGNTLGI